MVLYYLAVKTAHRLRRRAYAGRVVHALFRDEELRYFMAQKALSVPTCAERIIYEMALEIVEEKLDGFPYGVNTVGVRVGAFPIWPGSPSPSSPGSEEGEAAPCPGPDPRPVRGGGGGARLHSGLAASCRSHRRHRPPKGTCFRTPQPKQGPLLTYVRHKNLTMEQKTIIIKLWLNQGGEMAPGRKNKVAGGKVSTLKNFSVCYALVSLLALTTLNTFWVDAHSSEPLDRLSTPRVARPMVAAGVFHTVGLRSDGTVVAVGANLAGQCNVSNWQDIVQVAAGGAHTVGLRSDGTVVAVGPNGYGECNVSEWRDIVQVAAGMAHTVGLRSDGTVVAVGWNEYGQCNVSGWRNVVQVAAGWRHTVGLRSDGTVVAMGDDAVRQCNVFGWRDIVQVAAGALHTVGLRSNGTVVAVGDNSDGQCNVSHWQDIIQVAAGMAYTVGLRSDGTVVAVGWNEYGQCNVSGWRNVVQVAAGWRHTVGLRSDGTVVAVGDNLAGQCNVSNWQDIVQVAAGAFHTVGLRSNGTVVAVGANSAGQCNVSNWQDIIQVAAGGAYTVGLRSDGTVVAVGNNDYGQCGVSEWRDIVQVAAGWYHTVGLRSDGTVVAVGDNTFGQCNVYDWNLGQAAPPSIGTLTGKVTDAITGKGIAGATVAVQEGGLYSTSTNIEGNYTLRLPQGSYVVRASVAGYQPQEKAVTVIAGQTVVVNFSLIPRAPENRPPVARASDISGQPKVMYPNTEYTVTAKYFDPDGRADLKHCYLRLNHPTKPLTMMWYEGTKTFAPWAGEEGENYLTIVNVSYAPITEGNLEGYQLTWRFKINDKWPEVESAIDFGVYAWDDTDKTSGWSYDHTKSSFVLRRTLSPAQEELKRKVASLIDDYEKALKKLKENILTVYKLYYSFYKDTKGERWRMLFEYVAEVFSLISLNIRLTAKGPPDIADAMNWKFFALVKIVPQDVLMKILQIWPRGSDKIQIIVKLGFAAFKELVEEIGKQSLEEIGRLVGEALAEKDRSGELKQLLDEKIETDLQQLREQVDSLYAGLYDLSDEQAQAYSLEIDKIKQGFKGLHQLYSFRIGLVETLWDVHRNQGLKDWLSRVFWGSSTNLLIVVLSSWNPLVATGIFAFEQVRKTFYENQYKLTVGAQLMGLCWDLMNEGFTVGYAMSTSVRATLAKIVSLEQSCIPRGQIDVNKVSIRLETLVTNSGSTTPVLLQKVIDDRYLVRVPIEWQQLCLNQKAFLFTDYKLPYRLYGILPKIEVTENLIPTAKMTIVSGSYAELKLSEKLRKGDSVTFSLFVQTENGQLFFCDYRTFMWPDVTKLAPAPVLMPFSACTDSIFCMFENEDLTKLNVYYDSESGQMRLAPTLGAYLRSSANLVLVDASGRKTGRVGGATVEEIPGSAFIADWDFVVIFNATDIYKIEIVGTGEGKYDLTVRRAHSEGLQSINSRNMPTASGSRHVYSVDWEAVARGERGVTIQIDQDGDGIFEHTIQVGNDFTTERLEYTITATAGRGGGISPSGTVKVFYGGDQTFTITPDEGYVIHDVLVDGRSVLDQVVIKGRMGTYKFVNVTSDHTIHAIFAALRTGAAVNHGPNPVPEDGCVFWFQLPEGTRSAKLLIYNVAGRLVAEISLDPKATRYPPVGRWRPVDQTGTPLANGPYIYVLVADGKVIGQGKMVIQR